jgi:hypothetical protein
VSNCIYSKEKEGGEAMEKRGTVRSFALWGGTVCLLALVLFLLSGCGGGGGTQYFVSGKVVDAISGNPIEGATIKIYQAPKGRVIAGALLLGEDKTKSDGSYSIPISISGVLLLILSVEPPSQDYTPLEMEMNLDVMQKISLDAYLIKKDDLQRINRIEIKPPLAEGESYVAGMKYTFSYIAYDQNNNPMELAGVNWYAHGDLATIDSKGNFIAKSPDTVIIGIILGQNKWETSIPIIAPPIALLTASGPRAIEIKQTLLNAGFNVQISSTIPTNIGQARVLVIDESATLSTADASKVQNIFKKGGNVVLIGDAPAILATGNPLPPNNPDHQNWTPTDVSSISSWFFGVKKMMHVYDFNIHALTNGLVPLPAGLTTDYILECEESACALTPFNPYPDVSVIASSENYTGSPSFPNTEVGGWGPYKAFAIAQEGKDNSGRLYWQWNYKASEGQEHAQPGSSAKIGDLFINGVKWTARLLGPQPQ